MMKSNVDVAAAVILRCGVAFLCSRPKVPPPDNWEFPGGKVEPGETVAAAAVRELREECGVEIRVFDELHRETICRADGSTLTLHFLRCWMAEDAAPRPCDGQEFKFVPLTEITRAGLLPADAAFAEKLCWMA